MYTDIHYRLYTRRGMYICTTISNNGYNYNTYLYVYSRIEFYIYYDYFNLFSYCIVVC